MAITIRKKNSFILVLLSVTLIDIQPSLSAQDEATPLSEIAFVSDRDGNNEIYLMNADGSNQQNLTQNVANDYSPVWSPEGSKIAFTSTRDDNNEIYVMDVNGSNLHNLTNNPTNEWLLSWSPDGKFLAYKASLKGESNGDSDALHVMMPDGSNSRQVSTIHYGIVYPLAWSPDSKSILFFSEQYGVGANGQQAWETVFVDLEASNSLTFDWYSRNVFWSPDGEEIMLGDCTILVKTGPDHETKLFDLSQEHNFSDNDSLCITPYGWSPDGKQILFSGSFRGDNENNHAGLYIMNGDGTQVQQLTHEDVAYDAKWSPDGRQIVYVSERQIYVVDVGTNMITALTDAPGHNEYPVWRPQSAQESP